MEDSNGKEYCASKQEPPQGVRKAVEDVCEPRKEAGPSNDPAHVSLPIQFLHTRTA